jgi:tRNA uridine 5-carboxymethylaminomethyl modification enzyme
MHGWDVAVVGAGHAGCEAALAAARMGCRTLLLTMSLDGIGQMSCNPAVGGTAKGHLVREIDALGGEMGRTTDGAAIQFKTLNASRGPAVRATRAQCDRARYRAAMKQTVEAEAGLDVRQAHVARLLIEHGRVVGVADQDGTRYAARAVVVTAGTFLRGLIHVGLHRQSAGRAGELAAVDLSDALRELGLTLGRLKTGTSPRLRRGTIDWERLEASWGDERPWPFHWATTRLPLPQVSCHVTWTTPATHTVIRDNLDRSPLYSGVIDATGVRYCPSIEDKVVRFAERERHQVILEPDGLDTEEVYANGISTSLPLDVQERLVHTIPGLERAEIMRPGYAIEYDFIHPTQLAPTLECRDVPGLWLAGQVNGTTGYEEAAALGLWAGINAACTVQERERFLPDRSECYMAVLVDDLVTRGTLEPYRMFTSRAEHRLLLRIDNADLRLTPAGRDAGLIGDAQWDSFCARRNRYVRNEGTLKRVRLRTTDGQHETAWRMLTRAGVGLRALAAAGHVQLDLDLHRGSADVDSLEAAARLEGYIGRQAVDNARRDKEDRRAIPAEIAYTVVPGLTREAAQRLSEVQPRTLGQAARIPGVTPAAVAVVAAHIRRYSGPSA